MPDSRRTGCHFGLRRRRGCLRWSPPIPRMRIVQAGCGADDTYLTLGGRAVGEADCAQLNVARPCEDDPTGQGLRAAALAARAAHFARVEPTAGQRSSGRQAMSGVRDEERVGVHWQTVSGEGNVGTRRTYSENRQGVRRSTYLNSTVSFLEKEDNCG
jgi:hypothetical protein